MKPSAPAPDDAGAELARRVGRLSNGDIRWDGTLLGLSAVPAGAAIDVLAAGEAAIGPLVDALADASRFAAAHVVLTLIGGIAADPPGWNGLQVDLRPDGSAVIDPAQRFELARRWRLWQQSAPRLRLLPP